MTVYELNAGVDTLQPRHWCEGELCLKICKYFLINPHHYDVPPPCPPRCSPGWLSPLSDSDQLMQIVYGTSPLLFLFEMNLCQNQH